MLEINHTNSQVCDGHGGGDDRVGMIVLYKQYQCNQSPLDNRYSYSPFRFSRQPVPTTKDGRRCGPQHRGLPYDTDHSTEWSTGKPIPLPSLWPAQCHAVSHRSRASPNPTSEQSVYGERTCGSSGRGSSCSGCCYCHCYSDGNRNSFLTGS